MKLLNDPARLQQAVDYFTKLFESGDLLPVTGDHAFSIDTIGDAFRHMESNIQFGKVVVII